MNPIVLYLASGEALYAGAAVLLVVLAVTPLIKNRWLIRLRDLAAWVGLAMMVMACPPYPWWVDGAFAAAFLLWFTGWSWLCGWRVGRVLRVVGTPVLAVFLLVLPAVEIPYRQMPLVAGMPADHLVVIGDSLSAGIDPKQPPWPGVLSRERGIKVVNLAQAGAQVADAVDQMEKVKAEDRVVLVEIGGNDLIANVPTAEFARELEKVLAGLRHEEAGQAVGSGKRIVVMFELPLLPHKIGYGQVQRKLAARYDVQLMPKRFLIDVLGKADGTSDGLHLSPRGAERMAGLVGELLGGVLQPQSAR